MDAIGTPALPTDKTVISKRPPPELPLPVLPTPQTLGQALIGKTIDHYELVEFVGGGGMGAVFRAIDTRLGRTVAVKVLSRDHTDEETIKRFRNEAQSAARLDHPNIARVYFVGEADGWNYIVFEFIDGTNLRDIVEARGPLPLEEALNYTLQVAEALDHASDRDIVHRDIKPSNVLVTPSGQVKLVDMGLARLHQVESSSEDLTASGVMLGTFDYISPEQARDPRSADVRSDIYSLGCTLYFMLAARPPFPEGTAVQKLLKHNSEDPPDLRLFQPGLPTGATALVSRMLAKRPSQRPQTPQDLIAEILALAHQLGLGGLSRRSSVTVTTAQPAGSIWSRVLPILVPVAAMVLLLWLIDALSRDATGPVTGLKEPVLAPIEPSAKGTSTKTTGDGGPAKSQNVPGASDAAASEASQQTTGQGATSTAASGAATSPMHGSATPGTKASDVGTGRIVEAGPMDVRPTVGSAGSGGTTAEPSQGNTAPTVAGSEKPVEIKRIVVRKDPADPTAAPDVKIVGSVAQACQLAAEHGITKVELEFDGPLQEQPFDLTQQRISVIAADGFHPVILFRPQEFATDRDKHMIRLIGGSRSQVSFERVELRLELPSDASIGWALFALYQLQSLDLVDSVLTVKDAAGALAHAPVAMIAVQPHPPLEMMKMTDDMMAMIPSINVRLTDCIARGEATFLIAQEERPLSVVWNQGLLVTPQRLLETGGCTLPKPSSQDKFEIVLDHVTAIVHAGLARQSRAAGRQSHLRLEVSCTNSVLQWDRDATLFEFEGLATRSDIKLHFAGNNNLYPPQSAFLQQKSLDGSLVVESVPFAPEDIADWGDDLSGGNLRWENDPPSLDDVPTHKHRPEHYVVREGIASGEGFDATLLPEIPPESDREPTNDGTDPFFLERPDSP
jgi:serine/threonine-protein kinase